MGKGHFPLRPLAEEVVALHARVAASHRVTVKVLPGDEVDVTCNREMAIVALGALLRNSIQHGGCKAPIQVSIGGGPRSAHVRIEDGGILLDPALRAKAFSAEGQAELKTVAAGRYSRGLGLLTAQLAAQLAGVEVVAVDPKNGTNAFELRVPR